MTKINIVYDDMYCDADIVAVPDEIADHLGDLVSMFLDWSPPENDNDYWKTINGKKYLSIETIGFVKWLNNYHCKTMKEKAYIVVQNTNYCSDYNIIEF